MSAAASPADCLQSLVRERIDAWRSGGAPDAAEFLAEHPELEHNKSLVLDLVLEEYCLRTAAGDTLVKSTFCERFPAYRQSIFKMLEVQEYLDKCPQFAIDSQPSQWPQAGERFLGYEVIEQLGSGALARVYLAREPALGQRLVVIKVSRFGAAEAETLGKLSHPNIVPVHSVQHDSVSGWTAICMPLLGTATAVDLLDAAFAGGRPQAGDVIGRVGAKRRAIAGVSQLPAGDEAREWRGSYSDAIARLGLQLAEGLAAAHAAGVLHHDIKPSNVLLAWSGKPMLLDFNLSTDEESATERIGGTLPYMAPELIASLLAGRGRAALHSNLRQNEARRDPRCDIYSLGCVLYELLAGKLPARPAGADKLPLHAYQPWLDVKLQAPPALARVHSSIDVRLDAIVLKCLAIDPAERFRTADELVEELRSYLSPPLAARRYVQRNRRGFLAAGLGLGLSAIAAGTYLGTRKPFSERLLARGLELYDRGGFEQALPIFDECNQLNRDWPEARFARGQTLRQLGRFDDARDDFGELERAHLGWSQALVGFCHMRAKKDSDALGAYRFAYRVGIRDPRFVFNYADVLRRRNYFTEAVEMYSAVLAADPNHVQARRGRARSYYCIAKSQPKRLVVPEAQAFEDARLDIRSNGNSFEPFYLAAIMLGYAVNLDPSLESYREEGTHYLMRALVAGMPRTLYDDDAARLEVLTTEGMLPLIAAAPELAKDRFHELYHQQEFPLTANWQQFLGEVGHLPPGPPGGRALYARSSGGSPGNASAKRR